MTTPSDDGQGSLAFDESRVEREFNQWMQTDDGHRVEDEIRRRCHKLMDRGVRHYGIAALFESIRYDWQIGLLGDGEYRLNNNHRSLLSRHMMKHYPRLEDFFEIRELHGRS